ncbi:MAG: malto-oligosyltrehalose synthase, partial [Candidatus Dormibacteraceae bacterium]
EYAPLAAVGAKAAHVVAFTRGELVVVVPRLVAGLGGDWGDAALELPAGAWIDVITKKRTDGGSAVPLSGLLSDFPVAVLVPDGL